MDQKPAYQGCQGLGENGQDEHDPSEFDEKLDMRSFGLSRREERVAKTRNGINNSKEQGNTCKVGIVELEFIRTNLSQNLRRQYVSTRQAFDHTVKCGGRTKTCRNIQGSALGRFIAIEPWLAGVDLTEKH